jgi:hypothetical protein
VSWRPAWAERRSDPFLSSASLVVEGTSALSERVTLRGAAPEGAPCLACSSRRSYSKSRRVSHARDPGVRRPPRRGTSVGHRHAMATCAARDKRRPRQGDGSFSWSSDLRAFRRALAWPSWRYRTRQAIGCSCRRKSASGAGGENVGGAARSKARRLHARRNSLLSKPQGRSALRREEGRGPRLAGTLELDRVLPVSRVIAETNRRHLTSNKLAKRTSKKVAGACERWSSWSLFSGATRGEGLAKRCPDALSAANKATA